MALSQLTILNELYANEDRRHSDMEIYHGCHYAVVTINEQAFEREDMKEGLTQALTECGMSLQQYLKTYSKLVTEVDIEERWGRKYRKEYLASTSVSLKNNIKVTFEDNGWTIDDKNMSVSMGFSPKEALVSHDELDTLPNSLRYFVWYAWSGHDPNNALFSAENVKDAHRRMLREGYFTF